MSKKIEVPPSGGRINEPVFTVKKVKRHWNLRALAKALIDKPDADIRAIDVTIEPGSHGDVLDIEWEEWSKV